MNTTSVAVTAGMGGFLVLFGLMIVVWLLGRDMTRRLRRMRLAEEKRVEAVLRERAAQQPAQKVEHVGRAERAEHDERGRDGTTGTGGATGRVVAVSGGATLRHRLPQVLL